jgi:hypothetical protein
LTAWGALLKLTAGFLPAVASILPPEHWDSASFACCEMHMSAADALPAASAPAATAATAMLRMPRPMIDRTPSHVERRLSLDSLISLTPSLDVVTL